MNINLLTNPISLLNADANLIVLEDKHNFKVPAGIDVFCLPCKDFYNDELEFEGEMFCTLDIEVIFSVYNLCKGWRDLYIWDSKGLRNSWMVMLALRYHADKDLKNTFYKCATSYPLIAPSSLWFAEVFDMTLGLEGELIRLAEEYLTTKQIITIGDTFTGQWS